MARRPATRQIRTDEDPHRPAYARLHGIRDSDDDPALERARRHQPVAGLPRLRVARHAQDRRRARDLRRREPVRDHVGRETVPRRARRQLPRLVRARRRSGGAPHDHVRSDRGDDGGAPGGRGPGGGGHRLRAVLRELRSGHYALRRDPRVRTADLGVADRLRPSAGGVQRPDARDHREHPEQPYGPRVQPRGTREDRDALSGVRRLRDHGRGLRAHPLRRRAAHSDGDASRHAGPDDYDQRRLEDVRGHGLEDGDDRRAPGVVGRHPQGPRLPHRGSRRAPPGRRGHRPRGASAVLLRRARRRVRREAGPLLSRARGGRVRLPQAGGGVLRARGLLRPFGSAG